MKKNDEEILEKNAIYAVKINSDLKESAIEKYLNELRITVKKEIKKNKLMICIVKL